MMQPALAAMINPEPVHEEKKAPDSSQGHFIYHETTNPRPHIEHKNVVLFGETGVGKSSVINLMAGRDVADTSNTLHGCTRRTTEYRFTLARNVLLRVFDTVGLEKSEADAPGFISDVERAQEFIAFLEETGGVHLLLFCIEAGRFTDSMQRSYQLFVEILCQKQVPLALVITHLENEDVMEDWWRRNESTAKGLGIDAVAHACITATPAHVTVAPEKRVQSRLALYELFHDTLLVNRGPPAPSTGNIRNRLVTLICKPLSLLKIIKRRIEVRKKLEGCCAGLPRRDAQRLAKLIVQG